MKYKDVANNKEINAYLKKGNSNLGQLGFTDHSQAHCVQVAHQAGKILKVIIAVASALLGAFSAHAMNSGGPL